MQVRHEWYAGERFIVIYGEGAMGGADEQLATLIDRIEQELAASGLSLDDAIFHRLWSRSREGKDAVAEVRAQRFAGARRTASSSFISEGRFSGLGNVALEVVAKRPVGGQVRRLVDFDPPRRYAHYLVAGNWLFLSGMAEEATTIEEQFSNSLAEVEHALRKENFRWADVLDVSLFIECGRGDVDWMRQSFATAVPNCTARVKAEFVDGLASVDKHLEIEIIARGAR